MSRDVIVCGSGPAGLSVATACATAGLATALWSPSIGEPWHPTWGAWRDTVPATLAPALQAVWPRVEVHVGDAPIVVHRAYARFDTEALRKRMLEHATSAGVTFVDAAADRLAHDRHWTTVHGGRRSHRTSVVIDATGTGVHLDRRGAARSWQTAHGVLVAADGWSGPPRLMDFTRTDGSPTFLYALPLPDGRLFLEETSLLADLAPEVLRQRLDRRLAAMGLRIRETFATERCRIPMDLPVPRRGRVVGFGAAASMVHPSTGYLLFRVWDRAPKVAAAIAGALRRGPEHASRAAWKAIWSPADLARRALHLSGARALATLDAGDTRRFFEAFFSLPPAVRDAWLDDRLSIAGLASGMVGLFRRAPGPLRSRLIHPFLTTELP